MPEDDIKNALAEEFSLFLEGHTGSVYGIAVTADSKYAISCSRDSTLRIWEPTRRKQEFILRVTLEVLAV